MDRTYRPRTEDDRDMIFAFGMHCGDLAERLYEESAQLLRTGHPYLSLAAYKMAQKAHLRSVELMEMSIS